jgi:hypothetical protein
MASVARLVVVALAVAVPAAGLASLHHAANEVHAVCAEHGHLIHDDADRSEGWGAADREHEHCALDQVAPQTEPLAVAAADLGALVASDALEPAPAPVFAPRVVEALTYAPKQSPPLS